MSQRKRGFPRHFWCLQFVLDFWTFLLVGANVFGFFASMWVSRCVVSPETPLRKGQQMLHSFAFGGRGIFAAIGITCQSRTLDTRTFSGFLNASLEIFAVILIFAIIIGMFSFGLHVRIFDQTLGFPGEGTESWSKKFFNLTMTTWNCRSITRERFDYCDKLEYDILALTEL